MTSSPPTGPDVPYESAAPNAKVWTDKVFSMLDASLNAGVVEKNDVRTAFVTGPCPRCEHEVNFSRLLDTVSGENVAAFRLDRTEDSAEEYLEFNASCMCSQPHKDRPEAVSFGCGINFRVSVLRPK